jgi:ribosomal protein S1
MDQLIEQYSAPPPTPAEGEMAEGRVIAVTELGVVVDIGAKSEGLIPACASNPARGSKSSS